jgi:uncharacterized membrane protein
MVDNHQQSRKIQTNIETRRPTPKLPNRSPTRSRSPSQIKNKRLASLILQCLFKLFVLDKVLFIFLLPIIINQQSFHHLLVIHHH